MFKEFNNVFFHNHCICCIHRACCEQFSLEAVSTEKKSFLLKLFFVKMREEM